MTVYTTHSYIRYKGDGVQTRFPITFVFHTVSDIVVSLMENERKQEVESPHDYHIEQEEGGSIVVFTVPPKEGNVVTVERRYPQLQTVGLHSNSSLDLNVLEHTLDSLVLMIQEASQQVKKLQEEGELPTTTDYKKFDAYLTKALHTITTADTAIEEKYTEIQKLYEIIKELANTNVSGGGSTGDTENTTIALTEHDKNSNAHQYSLVPTGCVSYFMRSTAPEGWLILEKKVYSRSDYPELAKVLYCGDEANDEAEYGFYCSNPDNPEESRTTIGDYFMLGPDLRGEFIRCLDVNRGVDSNRILGSHQEESVGSHSHDVNVFATTLGRGSTKIYTQEVGDPFSLEYGQDSDLHPRNVALLACIKY